MNKIDIWRDRDRLAPLVAAWRPQVVGRSLFRVVTGPGWVRLHLIGDDRPGVMLSALPGAVLAAPFHSPLPQPLTEALAPTPRDPLVDLLARGTLTTVALLADDLVLSLRLDTPDGARIVQCQLFGSRGNVVVLDDARRLLWHAFPSPYPCLLESNAAHAAPASPAAPSDVDDWSRRGLTRVARQRELALSEALQRALARRQKASDRLVTNLRRDFERADGGEARRRDAETLAAHLHEVSKGLDEVTFSDPLDGTERTIALDPAKPPHANLEQLFKAARKAQRGRDVIAGRLDAARADQQEQEDLDARLTPLVAGPADPATDTFDGILARLDALQSFRRQNSDLVAAHVPRLVRSPDAPTRPFRRYRIDNRWDVWVGRSGQENDELTHRASHSKDLWLHAQGVAGSHVVIRTAGKPESVPRPVIEKAAALAALFSKARNSALVPVIWTERRYVRKPRKAPPGTAVCLREQNLFVEPGILPGVDPA